MSLTLGLAIIVFCVVSESFFSGSETAMIYANRAALRARANDGDRGAEQALALLEDETALFGTVLVGTNLSTVTGATVAANLLLAHGVEGLAAALAFTPFTLIFGEAVPKRVMAHHADRLAPQLARPLSVFRMMFRPLLWVVRLWNRVMSALSGEAAGGYLTRQELVDLLVDEEPGPIDPAERRWIRGVLSLPDVRVEAAMTPLVRVVAVADNATVGVVAGIANRTQHSRLPIYERRIDHIVGVVHLADLLFETDDTVPVAPLVRAVRYVPDTKRADEMFAEMRSSGDHFAVVVDEYGGCTGIVTLEDLLEELVGEIEDEHDRVTARIVALEDGTLTMPGDTEVEELSDHLGLPLPEEDFETVAGLLLDHLGHIPDVGEAIEVLGVRMIVEAASDRRIERVRVVPPSTLAPTRTLPAP